MLFKMDKNSIYTGYSEIIDAYTCCQTHYGEYNQTVTVVDDVERNYSWVGYNWDNYTLWTWQESNPLIADTDKTLIDYINTLYWDSNYYTPASEEYVWDYTYYGYWLICRSDRGGSKYIWCG